MLNKSRKEVGAAENNRSEVRDIIRSVQRYANGIYVFKDRGDNAIYVDIKSGKTAKLVSSETGKEDLECKWYEGGLTSKKNNGYVYTPIVINGINGGKEVFMCGTHSLIGMLAHTEEFDRLVEEDKTPELNHKNNKKWDNRDVNLEWTTKGGNTRHGKVVASLRYHYNDKYTHIEHNEGKTEFVVLNESISVKDIERYCNSIDNSGVFKCKNEEYISITELDKFVEWLVLNEIWGKEMSLMY